MGEFGSGCELDRALCAACLVSAGRLSYDFLGNRRGYRDIEADKTNTTDDRRGWLGQMLGQTGGRVDRSRCRFIWDFWSFDLGWLPPGLFERVEPDGLGGGSDVERDDFEEEARGAGLLIHAGGLEVGVDIGGPGRR